MPTNNDASQVNARDILNPAPERIRLLTRAALTVALLGLCVALAVPFLPAVTWGVALAIMAWPLHTWIRRHVSRKSLAAALSTLGVVVVILGPGLFVAYQVVLEIGSAADRMREEAGEETLRQKMAEVPALRGVVEWMERVDLDPTREVRKVVEVSTRDVSGVVEGSVAASIQFLVAVFILFYLFRDRSAFMEGLRDLMPLSRTESDQVFARAADSVHANLYATVITSLIDGIGGGLMFWALGLPAPFLWGVVMFVLSVLPMVGAALVWLPAAGYLVIVGHWPQALALVGWGVTEYIVVDNIVYVRLAGDRMRMHEVPALVAFLGGLAIFGMSGMILGPAIFAVTEAFLEIWRRRDSGIRIVAPAVTSTETSPEAVEEAAIVVSVGEVERHH